MDLLPALHDIWELARSAGPFGTAIMLYIWLKTDRRLERERQAKDVLIEKVITTGMELREALRELTRVVDPSSNSTKRR